MLRSFACGAAATMLVAGAMATVETASSAAARPHAIAAASCGSVSAMGALDAVTVTVTANGVSCAAAKKFTKKYYAGPHLTPSLPAGWKRHAAGTTVTWSNGSKTIVAKTSGSGGCYTPSGSPKPC